MMKIQILFRIWIKRTLGKGTFSEVNLGINQNSKEKDVIKILKKSK